jgi:2-keto-4-pentenoate hydratase/2-oxohepta-3-ene-1,7-dioic acid hydratase in catechol pathway
VFGYCTGNDLTARDLQSRTSQWMLGKTFDGSGPVGLVISGYPKDKQVWLKPGDTVISFIEKLGTQEVTLA